MIDTIATRAFSLNGTEYAKGDTLKMPLQQFNDLEPTGLVERVPAEKPKAKSESKSTPKKPD